MSLFWLWHDIIINKKLQLLSFIKCEKTQMATASDITGLTLLTMSSFLGCSNSIWVLIWVYVRSSFYFDELKEFNKFYGRVLVSKTSLLKRTSLVLLKLLADYLFVPMLFSYDEVYILAAYVQRLQCGLINTLKVDVEIDKKYWLHQSNFVWIPFNKLTLDVA